MKRLPSLKTLALTLAGLAVTCLLFGWLILPLIIQAQAEKYIAEKTGHHLTMNRPEFNPFKLSLHLSGLHLTQPDNEPLLSFRDMVVDLSAASIYRGAFVFDGIRLDGLEAMVVLLPNGRLNWSGLIDSLKSKQETSDSPLPKLDIDRFVLTGASVDFADKRIAPVFITRIVPLDMELTDISTLPNEKGQYKATARTSFGANLAWHGEISLEPLAMTGGFSVENVDIARLANYLTELPIAQPAGVAGMSADYRLEYSRRKLELNLKHMAAKLNGLKLRGNRDSDPAIAVDSIEAKDGSFDLLKNSITLGALTASGGRIDLQQDKEDAPKALQLGSLSLENAHVNLSSHRATLARITLKGGDVRATRNAAGRIDLLDALQSISSSPRQAGAVASVPVKLGWNYRVDKLELAGFSAAIRDETVRPSAELTLKDIAIGLEGISEDWKVPVPLRASFEVPGGGSFAAEGKITPFEPTADIRLKLTELNLIPAQPYLSAVTKLKLLKGGLSTEGRVSYNDKEIAYQGSFALRNLRLTEAESGNVFLTLQSLGSREFNVTPKKLDISELTLSGLDTQLIINKDKTLRITHIIRQSDVSTKHAAPQVSSQVSSKTAAPARPFVVNIDRFRIIGSEMDFADYSLALPFGTHIHHLKGFVTGISSQPGSPGQLELDGQVDDYGLARAVGKIDLLKPTEFMDLKVVFRNVEMNRLTPYSATFAGRKITSGKLSLDLEYKIHQRQLEGENQVVMDQLVLGERVESPEDRDLPLDLAIALLQDSDGRIDLGLPVSGSLDDPQFSYGAIIGKAIVNVFARIVTAPFRMLGALFGGGEKFENIVFEAGNSQLTPPESEKLVRLAGALNKRPNLSLEIHGVYAEKDRVALQDRQLRRTVLEKSGQRGEGDSDPGPISLRQPRIQQALEDIFSDRFGSGELAAIKGGFRQANPGQLEESATGRVMSGLSGLFHKKRTLSEQEVASLKGADFYTVLFDRLRNTEVVDNERLLALATVRGEFTFTALKAAGAPAARIALLAPEKVETGGRDVPVKLVPGVAAKPVAPASSGVPAN